MWVVKSKRDCDELQIDVMLLNDYNKKAHEIQCQQMQVMYMMKTSNNSQYSNYGL